MAWMRPAVRFLHLPTGACRVRHDSRRGGRDRDSHRGRGSSPDRGLDPSCDHRARRSHGNHVPIAPSTNRDGHGPMSPAPSDIHGRSGRSTPAARHIQARDRTCRNSGRFEVRSVCPREPPARTSGRAAALIRRLMRGVSAWQLSLGISPHLRRQRNMCHHLQPFYGVKTMRSTAIVLLDHCGGRRLTTHPFEVLEACSCSH
jgi:hypothetical protein